MSQVQTSLRFAMVVSAVGGFLNVYSYLSAGVFAGAQTGNLITVLARLTSEDWEGAGRAAIPILAFAGGAMVGAALGLPRVLRVIPSRAQAALGIEILLLVLASLSPISGSRIPLTIVLAVAAGLLMTVYDEVGEWSYSTTVMSNNIIKWSTGVVGAAAGQGSDARGAAFAFGGILLAFSAGAILTGLAMPWLGAGTIVLAACVVLVALGWLTVSSAETDKQ